MGPAHTKVVLVLFNDFECPSCRALTTTLEEIRGQYPESVSVVVRHWPIPGHRLALTAAYASICAEKFGKFGPMFRLLSANGTVSGDPDWANLAARVGITETGQFIGCMSEARTDSLVKADIADAARVGAVGTPTLLVNNEQYFGRPRRLRAIVRRHLEAQALP